MSVPAALMPLLAGQSAPVGTPPTFPGAPQAVGAPGGGGGPQSQGFMDLIRSGDPAMMQTLIRLGAGLMQPIQPGNTAGGVIGSALADSLDFFNQRRSAEASARREDEQIGLQRENVEIQRSRADTEATSTSEAADLRRSQLEEEQRQFDAQSGLREAQQEVAESRARLNDRLPKATTAGDAKVKQTDTVAKALIAAEKNAIQDGSMSPEQARYSSNPDLAILDATDMLEGRDNAAEIQQRVIPALIQALPFMTGDDAVQAQKALQDAIAAIQGGDPVGRLGTGGGAAPAAAPTDSGQGVPVEGVGTVSNDAGQTLQLIRMPDGSMKWQPVQGQ